jgi:hypothetical protein
VIQNFALIVARVFPARINNFFYSIQNYLTLEWNRFKMQSVR